MDASGAAGILAGLSSISGAYSNSNAQRDVANFKANQLNLNAEAANLQADSTIRAGNEEAGLVGKKVAQTIGQERASAGSQGVVADTGSAANVQKSNQVEGAMSENTIKSNAWRQAWGLRVEASNYESESAMTRLEGQQESNNTLLTGGLNALGDVMKGFS